MSENSEVKVIAQRYQDRPKSDPSTRSWKIADHVIVDAEKLRSGRMYVGDAFRVGDMLGGRGDLTHVSAGAVGLIALGEPAMDDQVRVASDRAGEMGVVIFREPVMAERLRRIPGALETFQQADLQRLLLRFAGKRSEEPLQLLPVG